MMYEKCTLGYLTKRKKAEILWIVFFVVLGVAIFLTGYLWSGVRANIFTVMAVLLVLPAAKHLVALIAMFRKKGVTKERYDKVKTAAGQAVLYTDYVFTSTEKIMHLDFLLVKNGNVLGVIAKSKQDVPYLKQYLTDVVKKTAPSYHVRLFESDEKLISHLQRLTQEEASENSEKTLVDYYNRGEICIKLYNPGVYTAFRTMNTAVLGRFTGVSRCARNSEKSSECLA